MSVKDFEQLHYATNFDFLFVPREFYIDSSRFEGADSEYVIRFSVITNFQKIFAKLGIPDFLRG